MLHILLVILKILGIILACLLGLLLLLILIVLFVPIRYRVDAKKREEVIIKMRANWLMRIVFVRIWFIDKQLHIKLRIFGITIWDNLRPKKEKKAKKPKKVKANKVKTKKVKAKKTEEKKSNENKTTAVSIKKDEPKLIVKETEPGKETEDVKESETIKDFETSKESEAEPEETKSLQNSQSVTKEEDSSQKTGKIKKLFSKFKGFFQKLSKLGSTIKTKVSKLKDIAKNLSNKKSLISVFFHDENNRAGIKVAFVQLIEVLKHCGPQKIEGYVTFGTGDPESTGKLLGVAAVFYGRYGKNITIEPNFEEKVFEAEGIIKGRIRFIRLLIIGIRIIRDDKFKALRNNVRKLKEEL